MSVQQCPHLVRSSVTNTEEQRGRGGLTKITISSQVACDRCKVFRAELVSTPPDGLDTLTRSSKVRKRYIEDDQSEAMNTISTDY